MPQWISKNGVVHPAKERVSLVNNSKETITNPSEEGSRYYGEKVLPGDAFIYEGPDRAAMFTLFKEKVETLGMDSREDPEMQEVSRKFNYPSVEAYMKSKGFDEKKVDADFKKKASVIVKHELPGKVAAINKMGGGSDTTGSGADIIGGFGEEKIRSAKEAE